MDFQRILFPVDLSDHAKTCLVWGARLVTPDKTREVHFLYVLHTPADYCTWSGDPLVDVEQHVDEFVREFNADGRVERKIAVRTGHPSTEICKYAADKECDLIVMATHGRTGLGHMVLGSTAEQVVRHASCPVLTMRIDTQSLAKTSRDE